MNSEFATSALLGQSGADLIWAHWPVWFVTIVLIVAAVIDGKELRVPNWLTFPFFFAGVIYSTAVFGLGGFQWSLGGAVVGLLLLLPLYSIGGMGAGDVKLLAGVGSWMFVMQEAAGTLINTPTAMFQSFGLSAVIGAIMAVIMVIMRRDWAKHQAQFFGILNEIGSVKDPTKLSEIAAERKSRMLLLPYGIPIAIGTIAYFAWTGMLV